MHSVSFHPHGTGFCTGGEDGYLRLHHFDEDYKDLGEEPELDDPNLGKVVKEVEAAVARLEREQKEAEKLINGPLPESESKTE
ncbi:TIF34 [Symbiodinium sp. KB8]|nr:TIF34 [Symbiodinium sp. KB8]